jgi:hypothetical protein
MNKSASERWKITHSMSIPRTCEVVEISTSALAWL